MVMAFTYSKSPVSVDRLTQEIRDSSITISLDYVTVFGTNLDVIFKSDVPEGDVATLDALVAAHTGEPTEAEAAQALAIGKQLASYTPSPCAFEVGRSPIVVDAEQKLLSRGQVLTDEGSFRDSFPGTSLFTTLAGTFSFSSSSDEVVGGAGADLSAICAMNPYVRLSTDSDASLTQGSVASPSRLSLFEKYKGSTGSGSAVISNWLPLISGSAAISVANSRVTLATGGIDGAVARIYKQIDYLPIRLQMNVAISQRIGNQEASIGLMSEDGAIQAVAVFVGSDSKSVTFRTMSDGVMEETPCVIPFGKTTAIDHIYTFEVVNGAVSLLVDDQLLATHRNHIPDAYDEMGVWMQIKNTGTPASSTTVSAHWVSFQSVNQVDIINSFSTVPVKMKLSSPSALDGKPLVSTTARPVGHYTYLSSRGDDFSDPAAVDHGTRIKFDHTIGGAVEECVYFDINAIENETHIHTAVIQWKGADFDEVECEIVPRVTTVADGTGTNYTAVGGVLVATPPGYGNKVVDWNNVHPVEMVTNEFGIRPAGYWDATFNKATKQFENFTFNAAGAGQFNIFTEEIEFQCFVPSFIMLGDGMYEIKSNDESRLGHNMRIKIIARTAGEDHAWKFTAAVALFRKRTC